MIPTYAASTLGSALSDFAIPEGDDKIIVSIHAYMPYAFALGGDPNDREFTPDQGSASEILDLMDKLKTNFTDKGIPVMIGEFGAQNKNNVSIRAKWASYYIGKAKELGIPCIWFDNGAFDGDGEKFGFLDREKNKFQYNELIFSIMETINAS